MCRVASRQEGKTGDGCERGKKRASVRAASAIGVSCPGGGGLLGDRVVVGSPRTERCQRSPMSAELSLARVEYGARASNKAVPLNTRSNIFEKIRLILRLERGAAGAITKYVDLTNARPADTLRVLDVSLIMVRSARFTPSGKWISFGG